VDVSNPAGLRVPRAEADYGRLSYLSARALKRLRAADRAKDYGKGLGVVAVDVKGNGRPDLYVANDTGGNFLYLNRSRPGQIRFEEVGLEQGVALDGDGKDNASMGVDAGDYDGSGRASFLVTNYAGELHGLFRNLVAPGGKRYFRYVTPASGIGVIGQTFVGWGTAFFDLTNRGREDLVISHGHVIRHPGKFNLRQRPILFWNQGDGRFTEITSHGGSYFRKRHHGRGLAVGDLDNDGRPDLVISHLNEPVAILRNVATSGSGQGARQNHWLGVELLGKDHADVIGAKVVLEVDGRRLTKFAKGGGSYLSSADRRFLFGLGQSGRVGRLTVWWASGQPRKQTWRNLAVDHYHRLGQGVAKPLHPRRRPGGR
jgi:hypothetical protein